MSLFEALRRLFGNVYQPRQPPRPKLTPEEEIEPRERRLTVDEAKTTGRGGLAQDKHQP